MSAQSPCGTLCINIQTGRRPFAPPGSAGVPKSRNTCDNRAGPAVMGNVRAAAGCGWQSRNGCPSCWQELAERMVTGHPFALGCHQCIRRVGPAGARPGMPSPGRAQRPGCVLTGHLRAYVGGRLSLAAGRDVHVRTWCGLPGVQLRRFHSCYQGDWDRRGRPGCESPTLTLIALRRCGHRDGAASGPVGIE